MKKIGKILALLLAFAMMFSAFALVGCSDGDKEQDKPPIDTEDPDDDKKPDDGDDDDQPDPPTGTEYKFEAEDSRVVLKGGEAGALGIASESDLGATETYVANFNANIGASITYYVTAEADTTASLVVSVCKRTSASVFTEVVFTQVGEEFVDSNALVPALAEGEKEWVTFVDVNLGTVELSEGENVISFTNISAEAGVGYNFNRMSLYTESVKLDWGTGPQPEPDPEGQTYYFEAEDAESNGWGENIDGHFNGFFVDNAVAAAHGGAVVRGLGENANKGYYFEFEVEAAEEAEYALYLVMGVGGSLDVDTCFPYSLNGEPVSTGAGLSGSWEEYKEYKIAQGTLIQGTNTLRFEVKDGCLANFDAIKIISPAELTGPGAAVVNEYKFEGEKAESNSWNDGTDWLWRSPNDAVSGGLYISHVEDAAKDHPGEAWISYTFTSDRAADAVFAFVYALGHDGISASAFRVELNGELVTPIPDTMTNSGWGNYISTDYAVLKLIEGQNTIKITVGSGAAGDLDYFTLKTEAVITHTYSAQ